MPYLVGSTIEASTYNSFASQMNLIMMNGSADFGYGQDPTLVSSVGTSKSLANVVVGAKIRASQWENLRNNIDDLNFHQGLDVPTVASAAIPPSADFQVGDLIIAYDGSSGRWNLPDNLTANASNRLAIDASQLLLAGSVLTNKRNTAWNTQVVHQFTATFSDGDAARHFFNSGGEIQIRAELIGASNGKNDDWRSILNSASTFLFGASLYFDATASTGNIQRLQVTGSAAAYTANDYTIFERRDHTGGTRGSNGSTITFTIELNDDATGATDENVTGSLTSIIDHQISTNRIAASAPVYATTISMSAGS